MGSFWSLSQSISLLKIKQIDFKMQSVLGGAVEKAGEAVSGAIGSNKKITDMKQNTIDPTKNDFLTSDFGVKQNSHETATPLCQVQRALLASPDILEFNNTNRESASD